MITILYSFLFLFSKNNAYLYSTYLEKENITAVESKDSDLSGVWEGVFTQKGGYKEEYKVTINIRQKGSKINGTTLAFIDDLSATLNFEGEISKGKYVSFKELDFLKSDNLGDKKAWCKKSVALQIKRIKNEIILEGIWAGKSAFGDCQPGTVIMRKVPERV
jgi:hypothetical protein